MTIDLKLLNDAEIRQLCQSWGSVIAPAWTDPERPPERKALRAILAERGLDEGGNVSQVLDLAYELIARFLDRAAMLQYLYMRETGEWTVYGEQRVAISFCRHVMRVPTDREVTQFDADKLVRRIDEFWNGLGKPDKAALEGLLAESSLDFLGIDIPAWNLGSLNAYIEYLDCPWGLRFGYEDGGYWKFILGEMERYELGGVKIRVFGKERSRSPTEILSLAGFTDADGKQVFIRMESVEVIYKNKWSGAPSASWSERRREASHPLTAVRQGIKDRALSALGIGTEEDMARERGRVLRLMRDNIAWNQAGILIKRSHPDKSFLRFPLYLLAAMFGDVLSASASVLADWIVADGKDGATMSRLCRLARESPAEADFFFWMTLSDYWFPDKDEDRFPALTDLSHALFLLVVDEGLSVDFARIESSMEPITKLLLSAQRRFVDDFTAFADGLDFVAGGRAQKFAGVYESFSRSWRRRRGRTERLPEKSSDHPEFGRDFWRRVSDAYPEQYAALKSRLESCSAALEGEVLGYLRREGRAGEGDASLRAFILRRYRELGIIPPETRIDWSAFLDRALGELGLEPPRSEAARAGWMDILEGTPLDLIVSYESERDPFLELLQDLLLKTGLGSIGQPIEAGECFPATGTEAERSSFIVEELENLRDQIESEMYLVIGLLEVNERLDRILTEEALGEVRFSDGSPLADKIKEVRYAASPSDSLYRIHVPLYPGMMDWATSQAVWRANAEIRPDEFIMQWTIDELFLEVLCAAAEKRWKEAAR
jgi:hypothetical protein